MEQERIIKIGFGIALFVGVAVSVAINFGGGVSGGQKLLAQAGGASQGPVAYYPGGGTVLSSAFPLSYYPATRSMTGVDVLNVGMNSDHGDIFLSKNTRSDPFAVITDNFLDPTGRFGALVLQTFDGGRPQHILLLPTLSANVGIANNSPTQKLDVAGNVKANGFCIGTDCKTNLNPSASFIQKRSSLLTGSSVVWCPSTNKTLVSCSVVSSSAPSTIASLSCTADGACTSTRAAVPNMSTETVKQGTTLIQGCLASGATSPSYKLDIVCSK